MFGRHSCCSYLFYFFLKGPRWLRISLQGKNNKQCKVKFFFSAMFMALGGTLDLNSMGKVEAKLLRLTVVSKIMRNLSASSVLSLL